MARIRAARPRASPRGLRIYRRCPGKAEEVGLSALLALRQATAEQHRLVEEILQLEDRCLTLSRYETALRQLHSFWVPAESSLHTYLDRDQQLSALVGFSPRATALTDDVRSLGMPASTAIDTTPLVSRSQAIGALYVMEGSRLGAKQLVKQLRNSQDKRDWPRAFFEAGAADASVAWSSFRQAVQLLLTNDDDVEIACEAARQSFLCLAGAE